MLHGVTLFLGKFFLWLKTGIESGERALGLIHEIDGPKFTFQPIARGMFRPERLDGVIGQTDQPGFSGDVYKRQGKGRAQGGGRSSFRATERRSEASHSR